MISKVILLHGKNVDPTQKWYPWFAKEMAAKKIRCYIPMLPHSDEPLIEEWKTAIAALHPDKDTILIGHSRGGVAVLRWLENQPQDVKVKRVILVAANSGLTRNHTIVSETNHGFYTKEGYDFAKIRQHCHDFVVLHSKDDAWVPYTAGVENAQGLHAQLITFENKGHFGEGVADIPELISFVTKDS
jgi:predicted alpha/beta hydrolase family esterase